ncbi:glycosyltransferase [Ohtaekwangia kribbensis]|uniref:Glycosyltransferase n=1 Tax=Ohtaekwangia kribbensis TaxID=688913 RepID=A0ABW3K3S2_9BACT
MSDVEVSVIIPTYNGVNKINVLLNALLKQTYTKFELVVVVDGSTDGTIAVLDDYRNKFAAYKVIVQPNKGRAVVRNRGVKESSGDLLIFYDDDMEPMHDSVSRHISFHDNYQGILGGNQIEERDVKKTDIQNYKATRNEIWMKKYSIGLTRLDYSNLFFTAANCSIKRKTFFALNGFDERLSDAEDYDFAYRAMQEGVEVFFDKSNQAFHHDPITAKSYIQRLRQYSQAHAILEKFYPERRMFKRKCFFLKKFVYSSLALRFWVILIDRGFLKGLPESARFKLYDLIIQALAIEYPNRGL